MVICLDSSLNALQVHKWRTWPSQRCVLFLLPLFVARLYGLLGLPWLYNSRSFINEFWVCFDFLSESLSYRRSNLVRLFSGQCWRFVSEIWFINISVSRLQITISWQTNALVFPQRPGFHHYNAVVGFKRLLVQGITATVCRCSFRIIFSKSTAFKRSWSLWILMDLSLWFLVFSMHSHWQTSLQIIEKVLRNEAISKKIYRRKREKSIVN